MPEVAVDEDGDAAPWKHDVWSYSRRKSTVQSETRAGPVQRLAEDDLRFGVAIPTPPQVATVRG